MLNELETLQNCSHPHMTKIIELLHDDSNYYIASEILEGGELSTRLQEMKTPMKEKYVAKVAK